MDYQPMSKNLLCLWVCMLTWVVAPAQRIIVAGRVMDAHTGEALPFAGVQFKATDIGAVADQDGYFKFSLDQLPSDSLLASVLGYQRMIIAVKQHVDSQFIVFRLERSGYTMNEVVVHAGVNPALIILRKIIQRKPYNNMDRFESYKEKVYNKLEFDINKIDKNKFLHSKLFQPFQFVLNNVDTSETGDIYLPILFTETISNFYFQRSPHRTKEIIIASKTSGIQNKSITRYLGTMYQNINVYDNFIPVFDKEFVSPIANIATLYYDYQLVDTQYIDGRRCFHITFIPKRKNENVFTGDFWVNDTTFAIQKMNLEVTRNANLNFVSRVSLVQEYKPYNDSVWFLSKDKFIADFFTPVARKLTF
ncbi:MAG: carboxypeptidase-like regulatory domain-containing protein, partial [Thermoflavifilum sp.]|nr:carboxypeptidase-like regulatory domain-containing protein [Thermoflavifilum sp.]